MGTIDQPKPSQPKSPSGDQQPLQPGGLVDSSTRSVTSTRVAPEATDALRDELDDVDEAAQRLHDKK